MLDTPPMYEYQAKCLSWMLKTPKSYLALDMGMGKTRITLEWCKYILKDSATKGVLVIAPLRTVHSSWPDEIEKWAPELSSTVLHGKDKTDNLGLNKDLYLMNFEGIAWLYEELKRYFKVTGTLPFRALVIDEGSMVKSSSTKRFKILKKLIEAFPTYRTILSGTPAPNSLLDLWSQYNLLDGGERLGKFVTHYKRTYFYQVDRMGFIWSINKGSADIIYKKIEDITYRLDSEDHLDLPDRIDNVIKVKLPKAKMAQYKKLEKEFFLELDETMSVDAFNAASLSMKLRQYVQGAVYTGTKIKGNTYRTPSGKEVKGNPYEVMHDAKLKVLENLVDEANGTGILCAIQFKFELEQIKKKFPKAPVIAGGTSAVEAARLIKLWNTGAIPLLLCHPASISHGVNLQFGSHLILWYGLTWSSEQYLQFNKRLHRNGQKKTVIVHHLVIKDTIDESVMKALKNKIRGQQQLLDYLKEGQHA